MTMFGGGYGYDEGAGGHFVEAAVENAEANMLEAAIGPNIMSDVLRVEAAVDEVEAVVDMFEGDW